MGRILMALWCIAVGVVCGEVLFSSIKSDLKKPEEFSSFLSLDLPIVICIYIASVPFWMD